MTGRNPLTRPVIPAFLSFVSGILFCSFFPGSVRYLQILIIPFFIWLLYLAIKQKKTLAVPLILIFLLGCSLLYPYVRIHGPDHVEHYAGVSRYEMTGLILEDPEPFHMGDRIVLGVSQLIHEKSRRIYHVTGRIRVSLYGESLNLTKGNQVRFTGRIKPVRSFGNPGTFDYRRFLMYQKIRVTSYSKSENLSILGISSEPGMMDKSDIKLDSIRKDLCRIIDQTDLKEQTKSVLKVLLTGQKGVLSAETRDVFSKSGTGHLLAISGLHTGIVAAFFMVSFTFLFRRSAYLLNRALVVKTAALLTLCLVVFYGFFTGMSDSTKRAVLMISVFLLSRFFDREPDTMNILALAGLVILVFDPCSLFSVSFIFSFTAVFFIILYLTGNEKERRDRLTERGYPDKLKAWFMVFFQVTVISSLATLPLTAFFFNRISVLGIGVNLIVVPAAVFLIVPSGLLAVVAFFIYPPLSVFFILISGTLLEFLITGITWVSSLPFAELIVITPPVFQLFAGYVLLISASFIVHKRGGKKPLLIMVCALTLCAGSAALQVKNRFFRQELIVTVLDVGQGTSVLVEFPGYQVMLVDSGGFYSNDSFDVGKNILARVLYKKGIKTIDMAFLSHPESDHYNGFLYLARHFLIKRFITNGDVSDSAGYQNLMRILSERSVSMPRFSEMEKVWNVSDVRIEILHPSTEFMKNSPGPSSFNDHSLVLKLTHGDHSFLLPGDIMKKGEAELASQTHINLKSQVLVVPHHGSKTSSSELFLDRVAPGIAVFSSGFMNRYMPHTHVLDRYTGRGITILRTDVEGAVTFRSHAGKLDIDLYYPDGHMFPLAAP